MSLKTPQNCSKEGRLKPFFANNIDIPFARARRLKPCPRKASTRNDPGRRSYRKESSGYVAVYFNYEEIGRASCRERVEVWEVAVSDIEKMMETRWRNRREQ